MTYTSDDCKPGDLAWVTTQSTGPTLRVLSEWRAWAQKMLTWWGADGGVRPESITDLRPAHVLGPDERAYPKGGVWLDPETEVSRAAVEAAQQAHRNNYAGFVGMEKAILAAFRVLAAEQNAPEVPEPPHDALVRGARGMLFEWDSDAELWAGSDGGVGTWGGVVRNYGPVTVYRPEADQ